MSGMWRKPVNKLLLNELRDHYGYTLKKSPPAKLEAFIPTLQEFMEWAVSKENLKTVLFDVKLPEEEIELVPIYLHVLNQILDNYNPDFRCIILSPEEKIIRSMKNYFSEFNYFQKGIRL